MLLIPVLKKDYYCKETYIERPLVPSSNVKVELKQEVSPYDSLARYKFSYNRIIYPSEFSPLVELGSFVRKTQVIGTINGVSVKSEFDGYLSKTNANYIYMEKPRDIELLSGVWGNVHSLNGNSILLKTQSLNLIMAACFDSYIEGEFVILPNPKSLELQKEYLKRYVKNPTGQIVYLGDYIHPEIIELAHAQSIKALVAGSCDRATYSRAKELGIFIGLFTGFGNLFTPDMVFNTIKDMTNRYIFIRGSLNQLIIPIPLEAIKNIKALKASKLIKQAKKGLVVQVLQNPHFGKTGCVDSVSGSSIFVRLDSNNEIVEVTLPYIVAIGD